MLTSSATVRRSSGTRGRENRESQGYRFPQYHFPAVLALSVQGLTQAVQAQHINIASQHFLQVSLEVYLSCYDGYSAVPTRPPRG